MADTSLLVAKITFVVAEIIFKVAVITSSVAMIIFVAAEMTFKIKMSEKSCWYSLKYVVNWSNGGIKYKLSALLYISYLT